MKIKLILIALLTASCAQKYENYFVIDKMNFNKDHYEAPITPKLRKGQRVTREYCTGQVFFASNAKKETDRYLVNVMQSICDDSNYLIDSKITETWWTTIVYSRSCVELIAHCPLKLKQPL